MRRVRLQLILVLGVWVCALAPGAFAQKRATGSLRLSVQAKNVALVKDGEVQLHWVLEKLPEAGDIVLLPTVDGTPPDETFRRELNAVLLGLAARKGTGEGSCLEIVVEERVTPPGCSLRDTLRNVFDRPRRIALGESGKPDPLKTKPAAEGAAADDPIVFGYLMGVTTTLISGLRMELETAYAQAAAAGNTVSRPLNIPSDLLPKGFSAATVSVTALYAPQDRYPGAGAQGADLFTDEQVAIALTEVAVATLRAAADKQIILGGLPDPNQARALATQIEADWGMNSDRTLWPLVSASVRPEANGMVPIHVSGLRLVREAVVSLTGAEVAVNAKDQAKLDDFRHRGARKVQEAHPELFVGLRGHVPRLAAVQNVTEKLGKPREVEGPFVVKSKDGVIFYENNFRFVISFLDAKFDAKLGLNPEERFTAGGSISGAKLFYLVPKLFGRPAAGNLGESHTLTAKGGPDFQTIDYTLSRDIVLWSGKLLPSVDMDWKRDSEQRFGPAFQPVPEVVARGIRPGISWTQFVEAGEKSRLSRSLSFDLGLPVRHTRLISKGASAADLINAQVTALSFEMRVGVGYEFSDAGKKGVRLRAGHANLQLHTNSKRGWQIMGGDSTFFKHAVDVDAVLPWGFTMPDQFQVRYARGAATASRSTPLFELYALGGSDNLRGVEAGEFVGRNLSWEQAEFGYNLFEPMDGLSKLLAKRKKAGASAAPAPAPPSPAPTTAPAATPEPTATAETEAPAGGGISGFLRQNGITTLLLKVAHDRGLTTNGGRSLGDLFSLPHAGHGWGVGFELGGLRTAAGSVSITLMRARSSASYVHPNGAWITGVRMTF